MTVQSRGKVRWPGVSMAVPAPNQARNLSYLKLAGSQDDSTMPLRRHAGSAEMDWTTVYRPAVADRKDVLDEPVVA
jgi:hypothetical protein